MNVLEVLAGQLAVQRQLIAETTLQQVLQRVTGGGSIGQALVQSGLLSAVVFQGLLREVQRSRMLCPGCGYTATPGQLDPQSPLNCGRCRAALIVATGRDTRPDTTPGTGRIPRQEDTRTGSARAFRRDTPATLVSTHSGSGRFTDPSGSMRFRVALEEPGGAVGDFELLEELGRGGMGVVYKARHLGRDEIVALKVLLAGALASKRQLKRFEREVVAMIRLDHPNVVAVKDVGVFGENPYFTMALVEGRPLGDLIRDQRLSVRRSAEVAREVALGLQHAHEAGIVHRDIKPDNILIDLGGSALITDFGLARDLEDDSDRLTRSGALVGTPFYMSPEQARGKRHQISGSTDIYAVGVVLYHMLTGVLPFDGETQLELMSQIVSSEPRPPSEQNPDVPEGLDPIVLKCLAKAPADRYSTAGDLADDIERYLEGRGVHAKAPPSSQPWLKIAVGVLLVSLLATGGGWFVVERRRALRERIERERIEREQREAEAARVAKLGAALERVEIAEAAAKEAPIGPSYRQALSDLSGALDDARDLSPKDASLALRRGIVGEYLHFHEQAIRDYQEAWTLDVGAVGCEALLRKLWLQKRGGVTKKALAAELSRRLATVGDGAGEWKTILEAFGALLRAGEPRELEAAALLSSEARRRAPNNAFAWAVDSVGQVMSGKLEAAVISGEQAAALESRHPFLLANRGSLRVLVGRGEEAADDAARALRLDPNQMEALSSRGMIRARGGDLKGGISDLERVLSMRPNRSETLVVLAHIYRLDDQIGRCDALLSRAEKADPEDVDVYRLRVELQLEQLRFDDALATLRRGIVKLKNRAKERHLHLRFLDLAQAMRRWRTLRDYASERLDVDPNDAWGLEALGDLSAYRGRWDEAAAIFDKLLRKHPEFAPGWEKKLGSMIQNKVALPLLHEHLKRFMSAFPDDPVALCAGVQFHIAITEDLALAQGLALRATQADPNSATAWRHLALTEAIGDRLEQADMAARRAIALDPDDYHSLHLRGEVMVKRKKLSQAIVFYKQALSLFPFYPDANARMSSLYLSTNQYQKAAVFIDRYMGIMSAANRRPSITMTIHQIQRLIGTRRLNQANDLLDRVLRKPPRDFDDRRFLSTCLVNANRIAEARELLLQLYKEDPKHRLVNELLDQIGRE